MQTTTEAHSSNTTHAAFVRRRLTEIEAAEILAVSHRTLQQWRVKGGGPPYQKFGAACRYDPDALAAWINAQTRNSTSDPGRAV